MALTGFLFVSENSCMGGVAGSGLGGEGALNPAGMARYGLSKAICQELAIGANGFFSEQTAATEH